MTAPASITRHVGWLRPGFADDQTELITDFLETATKHHDFDTIVGTGLSGALTVPGIARALGLKWAIVRKTSEVSHSPYMVEGEIGKRWLFVDDFVDSGHSLLRVKRAIAKRVDEYNNHRARNRRYGEPYEPFSTEYVGTYEYSHNRMYPYATTYSDNNDNFHNNESYHY